MQRRFCNLENYAQRPVGTFHALPIYLQIRLDSRHGRIFAAGRHAVF
jgi:hypothetical protein